MSEAWDESAWHALAGELDTWRAEGRVASFWWRDDDAGPPDPALGRLLDLAARVGLPLGLAVVPAWLTTDASARILAAPDAVVVLQHGFAHANHESQIPAGERKVRPAECGAARPLAVVLAEMHAGRERLGLALANRLLPVFVPPWNRIAPAVLRALPGLGYGAVSTFGPRITVEPVPGLQQLNCHADPIAWREAKRFLGSEATLERLRGHLVDRREGRADAREPTGLLTHHRDMTPTLWVFLTTLLERLRAHPGVTFPLLRAVFSPEGGCAPFG
ncbi:MAG: polysaccharide deacetylase family protein [Candidatus Rokuibacteriota bacterium]